MMIMQMRKNACSYAENNASPELKDAFYLTAIVDMLKDTKEGCKVCMHGYVM